jgi:hypothetical protein
LYSETTGKFSLAYHQSALSVGVSASGMLVEFGGGYENLSMSTLGLGVSYRFRRYFIAAVSDNLTSPRLHDQAVKTSPVHSLYAEFKGKQSYSITGRATFERGQGAQLAIGQQVFISYSSAVFWGLSTEPLKYGGGLELGIGDSRISYAFSNHPALGFTHTISVSYGAGHKASGSDDDFK